MRLAHATQLLSKIAIKERSNRLPKSPPPNYYTQLTPKRAEIWFPTSGCTWDSIGHCTTCNYGIAGPIASEQMYSAVVSALSQLEPTTETVWISAFNTLFDKEVPASARRDIFKAFARTGVKEVVTETHPASVRKEVVREVTELLDGRTFAVELGVETTDEYVRYACLNKPYGNDLLKRAIDEVHAGGAVVHANILAGIPFLAEEEVIYDISTSIETALKMGAQRTVLFPNHVKDHTIASLLAHSERYDPPDLWTLQAIIRRVPLELWSQVHFGWLDLKDHPGAARVTHEPSRRQSERLYHLLSTFNNAAFNNECDAESMSEAVGMEPPRLVGEPAGTPLPDRIIDGYRWLADNYLTGWWAKYGAVTETEVRENYRLSVLCRG